jgi:glycerol uptake facilitator-like aquaporin
LGGTVSGGVYNPARAFGPAIISGRWAHQELYWFADFLGAALAGFAQSLFAHEAQQTSSNIKAKTVLKSGNV